MGQEGGEKWTAAAALQPAIPKSDRLLGAASYKERVRMNYQCFEVSQEGGVARMIFGESLTDGGPPRA